MDIITLVKANVRHKKGTFVCIMLFMLIISMSVTSIVSLKRNFTASITSAYEHMDGGDVTLNILSAFLTDELLDELNSHPLVSEVRTAQTLHPDSYILPDGSEGSFTFFISPYDSSTDRLWNSDLTGFEDTVPVPSKGEIYLPLGMGSSENISVGNSITAVFDEKEYAFTVRGFVEEPVCGSAFIPIKASYVCSEDYEEIEQYLSASGPAAYHNMYSFVYIYKTADCGLSDNRFAAQVNKDTLIGSYASGVITKADSIHYQDLMPDIILNIFLSFVIILTVIVFVVMSNSISSGIDLNYTDLGILKAQGFDSIRLRCVFLVQYGMSELIGAVAGIFPALAVIKYLPQVFEPIVGIKITGGADILPSAGILAGILLLSAVFIIAVSGKIGRISPVRAVSGGQGDVFFDSRMNMPVTGNMLSASLALRQFTSGKRRYAASIAIASMLVFFLMTMTGMTNAATSENAHSAMGSTRENLTVEFKIPEYTEESTAAVWEQLDRAEQIISEYTSVEERYRLNGIYMLLDGEKLYCRISEDEDGFTVTKGRAPIYPNEIAVGQIYAEDMGFEIGDKLTVSYQDKSRELVITGFCAGTADTGRFFAMTGDAARTFDEYLCPVWAGYRLHDTDRTAEICARLQEELDGCTVSEHTAVDSQEDRMISKAASAIKAVIYIISVLFSFAAVTMVCSRTFVREKTDIGIYKAVGFTTGSLRLQFAVRFLIVALTGIVIGTVLSLSFSEKLLSFMLKSMGIANFVIDYSFSTVFMPIAAVAASFFVFAYLTASRIKNVEIRTLITE